MKKVCNIWPNLEIVPLRENDHTPAQPHAKWEHEHPDYNQPGQTFLCDGWMVVQWAPGGDYDKLTEANKARLAKPCHCGRPAGAWCENGAIHAGRGDA